MTRQQVTRAINRFKRTSRRKTTEAGKLKLAFNVPGTREYGQLAMLHAQWPTERLTGQRDTLHEYLGSFAGPR